jgi:CheY-like chemotaxis protein
MTPRVLILLAEDEPLIAVVMADALSEGGFEVIVADSGTSALELMEGDPVRFAAVVTDIRFGPGPDGWQLAQRARELVPTIPVIYMSGDSGPDWTSKGVPDSVMLAKPFATAQLVTAVATLITEAATRAPLGG